MTTRVWDYLPEYAKERDDILDAVHTVFESGRLVLGDSVSSFEDEFARYHGAPHCTGVDNGTNAVKLALEAVGVGPGDEVITVSNTAAPTGRGSRRRRCSPGVRRRPRAGLSDGHHSGRGCNHAKDESYSARASLRSVR